MAAEDVKAWLDETRVLLRAAELLVERLTEDGSEPDHRKALEASLDLPYKNLAMVDEWLRVGESAPTRVAEWTAHRFEVTREIAQAISPLFERIVNHEPDFLLEAWNSSEQPTKLVLLWGQFIGNFGMYVCGPLWKAHPEYAPPDWTVTDDEA